MLADEKVKQLYPRTRPILFMRLQSYLLKTILSEVLRKNSHLTFVIFNVTNDTTRTPIVCGLMYAQNRISVYSKYQKD